MKKTTSPRQGKDCFVASDSETGTRIREQERAQQLEQAARSAAILGLSSKELEKRVRAAWDGVTGMVKGAVGLTTPLNREACANRTSFPSFRTLRYNCREERSWG